ncbi:hypothetical protein [Nostoc sp.]
MALLSGQPENEKSANYSVRSLIFQDGQELANSRHEYRRSPS